MDKLRLDFDLDLDFLCYWLQFSQERSGNRYVHGGDMDGDRQSRNSEWKRDLPSNVCFQSLQRNKSSGYILGTRPRLLHRQQQHGTGLHLRKRTAQQRKQYGGRSADRRGCEPSTREFDMELAF